MKILIQALIAVAALSGVTQNASAGPLAGGGVGPLGEFASCKGTFHDQTAVEFVIRSTAVPTFIQGLLTLADGTGKPVNMVCRRENAPIAGQPSAGVVLWNCSEIRKGDGRVHVKLFRGGPTGLVTGEISQDQMYPLPAQTIGTVVCR